MNNDNTRLIEEELNRISKGKFTFICFKPTNRLIDWLFDHFFVEEQCDCFYDDWPLIKEWCNWYDPIGKGIWNMSQHRVDKVSKIVMKESKSKPTGRRNRFYAGYDKEEERLHIFWFGRDLSYHADRWWSMKKKESITSCFTRIRNPLRDLLSE